MASVKVKRKQWTPESMEEACKAVRDENMGLREASRKYNVPTETLRRRTADLVSLDCRPGPPTVLTSEEEARLAEYCVTMADMGFGLTRECVMAMAFAIADKTGRSHPFKQGYAGRGWYEGFMARQATLTLRTPQALSYARAASSSKETIDDFFAKLGAIYGRLNLISKPGQIFNADETGVTIVHKPSKVVAQIGRCNVPSLTSVDKGKTHSILACVSASGQVLSPFMIYPRKRPVPEKLREGAYPNTVFHVSDNGWMTNELFFEWFKLFVMMVPLVRPVLLVLDGHGSHITIEVIEYARSNEIHLLCLPSHTSHILQPLDVGVFKSFKAFFSKVCRQYMAKNPGRVITEDILATVVAEAFAQSHTPLNILGGFKKSGIYPFNPGEVSDRQVAPSKALVEPSSQPPAFSPEQIALFEKRYAEGYDVPDPTYLAWKSANYPSPESVVSTTAVSSPGSSASVVVGTANTATSPSVTSSVSVVSSSMKQSSEEVLSELLTLPQPPPPKTNRRKKGLNHKAREITDSTVLQELKDKERAAAEAKREKEEKKLERERKANERKLEKERKKLEREKKALEKAKERERKANEKRGRKRKPRSTKRPTSPMANDLDLLFPQLEIDDNDDLEDTGQCSNCGMCFSDEKDEDKFWVCCDKCNMWFCFDCHDFPTKDTLPDEFFCSKCV